MARFVAISLIIDVEPGEEFLVLGEDLPPPPTSHAQRRWMYHETLHLWQQASAAFLIRCTEADWVRMRQYEQGGDLQRENAIATEYFRVDPEATFSAIDLQECLARYWELQAFDPLTVLTEHLNQTRVVDGRLRERLQRFWDSPAEHPDAPLMLAMEIIGGRYARPFLGLAERAGATIAIGVFPLAAFFALQTDSPVAFYTRLVTSAIQHAEPRPVSADWASLRRTWFSAVRQRADELHEEMFGTSLGFGMDVLRRSRLLDHPGYAYLLQRMDDFVAQATRVDSFLRETLQRHPGLFANLEQRSREIQARYDETARGAIAAIGRLAGQPDVPQQGAERPEPVIPQHSGSAESAHYQLTPRAFTEFVVACPQGTKSTLGVPGATGGFGPGDPTTVLSDLLVPPCIRSGQRVVSSIPFLLQRYSGATELANHCLDIERRWLRFLEARRGY
jgi:hypothetical protein